MLFRAQKAPAVYWTRNLCIHWHLLVITGGLFCRATRLVNFVWRAVAGCYRRQVEMVNTGPVDWIPKKKQKNPPKSWIKYHKLWCGSSSEGKLQLGHRQLRRSADSCTPLWGWTCGSYQTHNLGRNCLERQMDGTSRTHWKIKKTPVGSLSATCRTLGFQLVQQVK